MRKRFAIYGLAAALILASWIGNVAYSRYYRLPEGRFLTHYIETTDTPYVAFDLLYAANNDDKRTIQSIRVDGLPTLSFYPVQVHQELGRQTIYKFIGSYQADPARKTALPPLVVRDVSVTFNDGHSQTMDIGEIIVYRDDSPPREIDSPASMISSMGSSSNGGSGTFVIERPAVLTATTSAWFSKLGEAFQYHVNVIDAVDREAEPVRFSADYPAELSKGQSFVTDYQFRFPERDPLGMNVFNVLLTHNFEETDGKSTEFRLFANYLPYFSESQMRAFVRAERRKAG